MCVICITTSWCRPSNGATICIGPPVSKGIYGPAHIATTYDDLQHGIHGVSTVLVVDTNSFYGHLKTSKLFSRL